jgi:hypothetical protein
VYPSIPIPGTGSRIHIPLWNRTSRAKERILWSLEYYMIRVQRIVRRVPLSHYPAPDLLRDVLDYKDLCEIAYVPDDVIRHASVTSNDRVNKILGSLSVVGKPSWHISLLKVRNSLDVIPIEIRELSQLK